MTLIIANIISFIGSLCMIGSGAVKNKKHILIFQSLEMFLFVVSNIILGGITGIIINGASLLRNIVSYFDKMTKNLTIIFTIVIIIISLWLNNLGFMGLLPLFGTVVFTIFMNSKNINYVKISLGFSMLMWIIYDAYIGLYISSIISFISFCANAITLYQINKKKKDI